MAAGFSVKDALNRNSKAGIDESPRARFRTKDISIFKMYRNEMNFYSIEQIEELAGDILMYGLKQNLELVYAPCEKGEYRIVAGERRWEALKYLVSNGYKEFEMATSKLTSPQDDDEEQVEIIIANAYREKTVSDMIEEEMRLKESLQRMKESGKKIKGYDLQTGRLREVISKMLHMSRTKVAQIEAINNNLISEWKEELKKEHLSFSTAYELSGMSEEKQKKALEVIKEKGELQHKDVKEMKKEIEESNGKCGSVQQSEDTEERAVSDSDTDEKMEESEERKDKEDDYETPHPEGITSLCYSCTNYEKCNVKTGTCTKCDKYNNRAEKYKTEEQRYSEEQDRIDKDTKRKLREMEMEEKMKKLPSDENEEKKIKVSKKKFEEYTGEKQKPYMIVKDDGFKEGQVIEIIECESGRETGRRERMRILCKDDSITSCAIEENWCVIGIAKEGCEEEYE